jgi:hypothetical protein
MKLSIEVVMQNLTAGNQRAYDNHNTNPQISAMENTRHFIHSVNCARKK